MEEMSSHALRTRHDLKRNKVKIIPLAEDVHLLSDYLKQTRKTAASNLMTVQVRDRQCLHNGTLSETSV